MQKSVKIEVDLPRKRGAPPKVAQRLSSMTKRVLTSADVQRKQFNAERVREAFLAKRAEMSFIANNKRAARAQQKKMKEALALLTKIDTKLAKAAQHRQKRLDGLVKLAHKETDKIARSAVRREDLFTAKTEKLTKTLARGMKATVKVTNALNKKSQ